MFDVDRLHGPAVCGRYWGWRAGVSTVPLSGHNIVISDDSLETTEHLQPAVVLVLAVATNKKHP